MAQGTTPVLAEALTNQNVAEPKQIDPIATCVRESCGLSSNSAVCKDTADSYSMLAAASSGSPHTCSILESSSGSSSYNTGHVSSVYSMTASDDPDTAAAAVEGASASLAAFDTASEVQLMAAQVLQRKQQKGPAPRSVPVQDPIHLLRSDPDKALRARKELLMSAASTSKSSSADGGSARVAAVKEELAGVQARLRDALGLRESVSEELYVDHYYQPPPLKRSSHDHLGCPSSSDSYSSSMGPSNKTYRLHSTSPTAANAAGDGQNFGPKAAALSFKKAAGPSSAAAAAAAVPSGSAARARAAGGPVGGSGGKAAPIYFDTSSEVAEMAARVLRRANAASLS